MCFWIYIKVTFEWHVKWPYLKIFIYGQTSSKCTWHHHKYGLWQSSRLCHAAFFLISDSVLGWFCNFLQMGEEKSKKFQFFTLPENNRGRLMEKRTALGKETNNTFLILNCVNRDKKGNVWCTKRVVGLGHEQFELNIILQKVIVNEYFFILTKQKTLFLNQTHPIYI